MSGRLVRIAVRALDRMAGLLPATDAVASHIRTGRAGEDEAYFHLRKHGYVIIARNYRSPRARSELDLVGWDDGMLCFIEVKTRSTRDVKPAEAAVNYEKQRDLSRIARELLRKMPGNPPFRFDIVSVYLERGSAPDITVFKNAFHIA